MKVAILGTNGLLASSIGCYYSKRGYELNMYGLSEPSEHLYSSFTKMDLMNSILDYCSLKKNDIIVYAIGAGIQSNLNEIVDIIYTLNVNIPVKICNGLKSVGYNGIFVTFGSYFEIGFNTENRKFSEIDLLNSQLDVFSDYSISKRMLSRFMSSFKGPFKTWHFILPTIYGENEAQHRLIPYTLKSIKKHLDLNFTSGEQIRQYIYVNEIPEIIFKAFDVQLECGIYNVAGTESLSVKELVKLLFNLMNAPMSLGMFGTTHREDVGMKNLSLDGTKLYDRLNFQPSILIKDVYMKYNFD